MTKMTDDRLRKILDKRENNHLTLLRSAGCKCAVPLMQRVTVAISPTVQCRICNIEKVFPEATIRAKFEGENTAYVLNQARLAFVLPAGRRMMTTDGRPDESESAQKLRKELRQVADTFTRIAELVHRSMRIPVTNIKVVKDARTLALALRETRAMSESGLAHYEKAIRFIDQYDHTKAISDAFANAMRE